LPLHYKNIPVLDLTAPTPEQLVEAVRFMTEHAATGTVYVHCKVGYSRSAAAVAAWLLSTKDAPDVPPTNGHCGIGVQPVGANSAHRQAGSLSHAAGHAEVESVILSLVRVRPSMVVRPEIQTALYAFHDAGRRKS
jgi:hypothetical protein